MSKSANQMWKESGAKTPFKQWLKDQQSVGNLEEHEGYNNADGNTQEEEAVAPPKKMGVDVMGISLTHWAIGIGIVAVGYYMWKRK